MLWVAECSQCYVSCCCALLATQCYGVHVYVYSVVVFVWTKLRYMYTWVIPMFRRTNAITSQSIGHTAYVYIQRAVIADYEVANGGMILLDNSSFPLVCFPSFLGVFVVVLFTFSV